MRVQPEQHLQIPVFNLFVLGKTLKYSLRSKFKIPNFENLRIIMENVQHP